MVINLNYTTLLIYHEMIEISKSNDQKNIFVDIFFLNSKNKSQLFHWRLFLEISKRKRILEILLLAPIHRRY